MDEVAFVESLFSPEMRSTSVPMPPSVFSSPSSLSCGRVKALTSTSCTSNTNNSNFNFNHNNINSLVPAPPNSLLGGGIALSQLHAPFQPLTADDAPLFVRLHDDDVFSQMLNDQDFPDFASGLKREHDSGGKLFTCSPTTSLLLEPLELPRLHGDMAVKDSGYYTDIMSFQQSSSRPRRSGILTTTAGSITTPIGHGYTVDTCNAQLMTSASSTMSAPLGFDPTSGGGGGTSSSYTPLAAHAWMQEEVSTPMSAHCQRLHLMKHVMALATGGGERDIRQSSPGSVGNFNVDATPTSTASQSPQYAPTAPLGLWISTSRNACSVTSDDHRTRQALEHSSEMLNGRSPLSMTISPPSSLTSKAFKELIVSTDFGLPPRQKCARLSKKDDGRCNESATKAARTMAASPVRQLCSTIESKGNVAVSTTKGKKCIEGGCTRRAQSNSRCKAHGGGARCQYAGPGGCARSSQGGGFCRAHGGGKRCEFPGCTRGQQRKGRCYVHGGIRKCQYGTCEKKDRGNGFCISHGGGKRCEHPNCSRAVRRGLLCQIHETQQVALATERQQRESVLV